MNGKINLPQARKLLGLALAGRGTLPLNNCTSPMRPSTTSAEEYRSRDSGGDALNKHVSSMKLLCKPGSNRFSSKTISFLDLSIIASLLAFPRICNRWRRKASTSRYPQQRILRRKDITNPNGGPPRNHPSTSWPSPFSSRFLFSAMAPSRSIYSFQILLLKN